jgi:hypothetical protein
MTRHVARKIHILTIVAVFVAMVTALACINSVAQESGSVQAQPGSLSSVNSLFSVASSYPVGHDVGAAQFVAVADVNGDGNPDLVVAGQNCAGGCSGGGKVSVLLANSNGRGFQSPVVYDSGGQWCSSVALRT